MSHFRLRKKKELKIKITSTEDKSLFFSDKSRKSKIQ